MRPPHDLLWVDGTAGLSVGLGMLALSGWLSALYALPEPLYFVIAIANTGYGLFSLSLAMRHERPMRLIISLVIANAAWAVLCFVGVVALVGEASFFGLAHLFGEGTFVGGLAWLEWKYREALRFRGTP